MSSWYQWSRPATMSTALPVRLTTTTAVTDGVAVTAWSTAGLSSAGAPRR